MHRVFRYPNISIEEMAEFYKIEESAIPKDRPYVWYMFVMSADGIGSFMEKSYKIKSIGLSGPGIAGKHLAGKANELSGAPADYRLLQYGWATADGVLGGAGIIRAEKNLIWEATQEDLLDYRKNVLGKSKPPTQIVVTGKGLTEEELNYPIFNREGIDTIIATSERGFEAMEPYSSGIRAVFERFGEEKVGIPQMLSTLRKKYNIKLLDLQGGPRLFGEFVREFSEEGVVDEYRLTISPLMIGNKNSLGEHRPGPLTGVSLGPDNPIVLGELETAQAGNHLFLRYKTMRQYKH